MFDGGAEQFQQLIAPQRTTTLPLHHLPFPLSSNPNNTFLPFDPYNNPTSSHLQTNDLLHHKDEIHNKEVAPIINTETELPDQNLIVDSWTNDEVLALLRIRSSMENWFPELTWEHVSRKLGEIGFKKSADKCKEKFEDESRYFDNFKNYRFLRELEELCQPDHHPNTEVENSHQRIQIENENQTESSEKSKEQKMKKRKKRERLEITFKGFCESIVNKMMAQQEETQKKLIQDMLRRDQEKLVREEEWKKQEMDKMNQELEIMAQDLVIAEYRHASIVQFLNKYASQDNAKLKKSSEHNPNNSPNDNMTPNDYQMAMENPNSSKTPVQVPSSSTSSPTPNNLSISEKENVGRRWPRDEVLALINLRCNAGEEKEANNNNNNKVPLWERISQGMVELGYKRSTKRCKEKWENINKYFRKTKDVNKKRSFDSRTCPYFHQLSYLYSQGKLAPLAGLNATVGEAQAQAQAQAQPTSSQVESLVVC